MPHSKVYLSNMRAIPKLSGLDI